LLAHSGTNLFVQNYFLDHFQPLWIKIGGNVGKKFVEISRFIGNLVKSSHYSPIFQKTGKLKKKIKII
jgi:hypothetical protein